MTLSASTPTPLGEEAPRGARRAPRSHSPLSRALLLSFLSLCLGCGGYTQRVAKARHALERGDAERSVAQLDKAIEDAPEAHLPLLHLERAIARHQLGALKAASEDYQYADELLEVLDYTSATAEEVASYLYSDDSAPYRPPAYEKALINLLNLMSYLERGELSDARVEGRRFRVYADYFKDRVREGDAEESSLAPLLTLGAALGAYVALSVGDRADALRWAEQSEQLTELVNEGAESEGSQQARLLILSSSGLIAQKRPVRLGLGGAMLYLNAHPGHGMSAEEHRALQRSALSASVKWVNFVELKDTRPPRAGEGLISGLPRAPSPLLSVNLSALARSEFEVASGKMLTAALTRLLTRAAVGAGSRAVTRRRLGPLGSLLLGLVIEGGMSAADTPDTRAWSTLPAQLSLFWLTLPPGTYQLSSRAPNSHPVRLTLKAGDWRALSLPRHHDRPTLQTGGTAP